MSKVIAVVGVLILSASAFGAGLHIQEAVFSGSQFYVDIEFVDLTGATTMGGVSLGVTLTGGGGVVTPYDNTTSPHPNRYNGSTGASLVAPDTYAWATSASVSNSAWTGTHQTFIFLDDGLATFTVNNGYIAARVHFLWDGNPITAPLTVTVHGETGPTGIAYYFDESFVEAYLDGDELVIPEPATMALLGLGLAGLALRRRK